MYTQRARGQLCTTQDEHTSHYQLHRQPSHHNSLHVKLTRATYVFKPRVEESWYQRASAASPTTDWPYTRWVAAVCSRYPSAPLPALQHPKIHPQFWRRLGGVRDETPDADRDDWLRCSPLRATACMLSLRTAVRQRRDVCHPAARRALQRLLTNVVDTHHRRMRASNSTPGLRGWLAILHHLDGRTASVPSSAAVVHSFHPCPILS